MPVWRVQVFDLNLWTFDRLHGATAQGEFRLDTQAFPGGVMEAAELLDAADAFRGKNNAAFHDQPDLYDRFGDGFLRITVRYTKLLTEACEAHHRGGPRSPLIQQFLDAILAHKPDVVGFSMIFSNQFPVGALPGKILRQEYGLPVLFGGSCFADAAEHFLNWYQTRPTWGWPARGRTRSRRTSRTRPPRTRCGGGVPVTSHGDAGLTSLRFAGSRIRALAVALSCGSSHQNQRRVWVSSRGVTPCTP